MDYSFKLFDLELLKFTGIYFDSGGIDTGKFGLELGSDAKAAFEWMQGMLDKARSMGSAVYDAGAYVVGGVSDAAVAAGSYVADGLSNAYDYVTSW